MDANWVAMSVKSEKRLSVRLSERRLNKLREYAELQEKSITQVVSDWIDHLKIESGNT